MKVTVKMRDVVESPERRLALRRYVHAELSRFGPEVTSIDVHIQGATSKSCRVVVRGRRFDDVDVDVASEGEGDVDVVAAAMSRVQAEVAAAIARTRSGSPSPRGAARGAS